MAPGHIGARRERPASTALEMIEVLRAGPLSHRHFAPIIHDSERQIGQKSGPAAPGAIV
jgi:hypothetical protein